MKNDQVYALMAAILLAKAMPDWLCVFFGAAFFYFSLDKK